MVSASPSKDATSHEKRKHGTDPSQRAKWWYSTFHSVTAMIGAGVLSLPYAVVGIFRMSQNFGCHDIDLGQHALGQRLGLWLVLPQQLIVQVGCGIVYMVTGGKCLKKFMEIICMDSPRIRQSYWICIFGSVHFFLSYLPNIRSVAGVSLAVAIMSLSYSIIAWAGSLEHGRVPNMSCAYNSVNSPEQVFRVFDTLGQISSAFTGHLVVLEIQATIPSTPEAPSIVPMWKGVVGAYLVNAICYFPVALIGYWAFGQDVDNVLIALERPSWPIANLTVVVHVIDGYQVYAMPVFDLLETAMLKRANFPPGRALRLLTRSAYVAFTLLVGVTFPFFGNLLGFFGGFGFASTSYFLPTIMWLGIKKRRKFSIYWFVNLASIIIRVLIMMASTIGGLRNIVADASTCRFYA